MRADSGSNRLGIGSRRLALFLLVLAPALAALPGTALAVSEEDKANQLNEREGGPIFVPVQPFVIIVVNERRVTRQVIIAVSLELFPGKRRDQIEEKNRQLYDTFMKELYTITEQHSTESRTFNTDVIKTRLLARAQEVCGSGIVRAVLIKAAYERPMRY